MGKLEVRTDAHMEQALTLLQAKLHLSRSAIVRLALARLVELEQAPPTSGAPPPTDALAAYLGRPQA